LGWTLDVIRQRSAEFLKVPLQTIVTPVIAAVLFLAVFALAGATRGLMVAVIVVAAMAPIASVGLTHAFAELFFCSGCVAYAVACGARNRHFG
jgi:hypothetical protein